MLISHKKMYVPLLDGTLTLQKLIAVLSTISIALLLGTTQGHIKKAYSIRD